MKLKTSRNLFATYSLLCVGVLAVDGEGSRASHVLSLETNFVAYYAAADKSPVINHTRQFVKTYIERNNESLHKIKQRSSSPFSMMDSVFRHYKLPLQLKYMAVIESELKTTAVSPAGAVGPWQLMAETAHILGLKVNRRVDERKNYYKSTRAAARYLKDLHQEFGDWLLVIAAYNAGEGSVYAAIREADSRNYWVLQSHLPLEPREYVKKFIATCYYFEGQGSLAELSKKQEPDHRKTRRNLISPHSKPEPQQPFIRIDYESTDDKFSRLMKQSEESLQRTMKVLDGYR